MKEKYNNTNMMEMYITIEQNTLIMVELVSDQDRRIEKYFHIIISHMLL